MNQSVSYMDDFDDFYPEEIGEDFDDYLYRKTGEILNNTLSDRVSSEQKRQFIESISNIMREREPRVLQDEDASQYELNIYGQKVKKNKTRINFFCFQKPGSNSYMPTFLLPPPMVQYSNMNMQPNPYLNGYAAYQMPPNYNYVQQMMPPAGFGYNQPIPQPTNYQFNYIQPPQIAQKDSKKKKHHKKKSKKSKEEKSTNVKEFVHVPGQEFEGIIAYLTKKVGQNVHDNGIIEVTANSRYYQQTYSSKTYLPQALLNEKVTSRDTFLGQPDFFAPEKGNSDFWIVFDFKKMKVKLTSYTIKNTRYVNVANIKNWFIEVSDDNKKWTQIDQHRDSETFKKGDVTETFNVTEKDFVRYVRFRHTGDFWLQSGNRQNSYIGIQSIEFYGKLKE